MVDAEQKASEANDQGSALLEQSLSLWIRPELERRFSVDGRSIALNRFQIVMSVAGPHSVRLNEEVNAVVEARAARPIARGERLVESDITELVGLTLTDGDKDAAHITGILHGGFWYLFFDFRYNSDRIARYYRVAGEFLVAAERALELGHVNVAIENLYAAAELGAKGFLLTLPDKALLEKHGHRFTEVRFNALGKAGGVEPAFVSAYNAVSSWRTRARFPNEALSLSPETVDQWRRTISAMLNQLDRQRPRTTPIPDDLAPSTIPNEPQA